MKKLKSDAFITSFNFQYFFDRSLNPTFFDFFVKVLKISHFLRLFSEENNRKIKKNNNKENNKYNYLYHIEYYGKTMCKYINERIYYKSNFYKHYKNDPVGKLVINIKLY